MSTHESTRPARSGTGRPLLAVAASLLAVAAFAATPASAATWTGTAHGKIERSNRLVSGGTSWHGNLWFRTGGDGTVRGHAVVAYEPAVDVSGLSNAIDYVKTLAGPALGLLGPFGEAASGAGLGLIVGADVSFKSAMAIRRGPLSGQLRDGRLSLRWNEKLAGIPYDIEFQLVSGSQRIGGGRAALRNPFRGAADRVDGRAVVHASESQSESDGVTEQIGSYWAAHRVG